MRPPNFLISGGYEGNTRQSNSLGGLTLVNTAVEAMFKLRRELVPDAPDEKPYPDRLNRPLVDLPPNNCGVFFSGYLSKYEPLRYQPWEAL